MTPFLQWRPWLVAMSLLVSFASAQTVGVPDFQDLSGKEANRFLARTLSDALADPLRTRHGFQILERSNLSSVLGEDALARSGATTADTTSGGLRQAEFLVLGSWEGGVSDLRVQARAVRAGSGEVLGQSTLQGSLEVVLEGMPALAEALEAAIRQQQVALLAVTSHPSGLEVLLDGLPIGRTPLRGVRVKPGRRHLALRSGRREVWRDSLSAEPGQDLSRHAALDPSSVEATWLAGVAGGAVVLLADNADSTSPTWFGSVLLERRGGRWTLGARIGLSTPANRRETYPSPLGTGDEARSLRVGEVLGYGLRHFGGSEGFDPALGLASGALWSRDIHPSWRTDHRSRIDEQWTPVLGPMLRLGWRGGWVEPHLEVVLPVAVLGWQQRRIHGQELWPIGSEGNFDDRVEDHLLPVVPVTFGLRLAL